MIIKTSEIYILILVLYTTLDVRVDPDLRSHWCERTKTFAPVILKSSPLILMEGMLSRLVDLMSLLLILLIF